MNATIEARIQSILTNVKKLSQLNSEGKLHGLPWLDDELAKVDNDIDDILETFES